MYCMDYPFAGALVLLWRRGSNVLTASQMMVTQDERIRLMDGYNLEIAQLEPQDAGDYVCQISDKVNKDQIHTVEILGMFIIFFGFGVLLLGFKTKNSTYCHATKTNNKRDIYLYNLSD